jgi:hypothetical protein
LLALNDPEKPAGEVRGLGLGMLIVCIGYMGGAGFKGGYDMGLEIIFISFLGEIMI